MNFGHALKLLAATAALAALTVMAPSTAAATTTPAPGYGQFAGCPHPGENPEIATCFRTVFSGGELQLGSMEIPIENPFALSGGTTAAGIYDDSPKGGLQSVKQIVPGGVVGLTGMTWLEEYFGPEALTVYAVAELVNTPSDPLADPFTLPIKVHLVNAILGSKCYVATTANPIKPVLTTGTTNPPAPNVPITGLAGEHELTPSGVTDEENGIYVDNSFAVPVGANGCFLTLFGFPPIAINGLINERAELPSAAGNNSAILAFDTESVAAATVYP